ncbi:hypothetical protein RWE15_02190 [Virgibacillus halophilus]|uniref:Glucokinase n=1 Tax=Tigheibacillus halophilus TaxID=361280 RepID=A0ABU5C2C3_9BACI|nr:hypothetical protein [Virgibacillus halophilus]
MEALIIGLDIGGTSTKAGLVDENGEVIYKWEIPTDKKRSRQPHRRRYMEIYHKYFGQISDRK